MKVLVACEESQVVCKAFRERGHEAYSCDIKPCSGGHPEWHIKCDVRAILNRRPNHFTNGRTGIAITFTTQHGAIHTIEGWDLIIAHPPCTFLSSAGASRLFNKDGTAKDGVRYIRGLEARDLFIRILDADCPRIAIENPTPLKIYELPRYTQIINPYMFGNPWRKRTCLWLKGLPELEATNVVEPDEYWVGNNSKGGHRSQRIRGVTAPGIADAMAAQWSI